MARNNMTVDEEKRNKINFTLPSNNTKSNVELSEEQVKLKDKLMKLIIDTKDEAIELKVNGEQYRKIGIHDEWIRGILTSTGCGRSILSNALNNRSRFSGSPNGSPT